MQRGKDKMRISRGRRVKSQGVYAHQDGGQALPRPCFIARRSCGRAHCRCHIGPRAQGGLRSTKVQNFGRITNELPSKLRDSSCDGGSISTVVCRSKLPHYSTEPVVPPLPFVEIRDRDPIRAHLLQQVIIYALVILVSSHTASLVNDLGNEKV